jgi:hypothetical protein
MSRIVCCLALLCSTSLLYAQPGGSEPNTGYACTKAAVRQVFGRFVTAFNRGDLAVLDGLFASPPEFKWYSSGKPGRRFKTEASNRATLIPYFEHRHAQRDHLKVLVFHFQGRSMGLGHFWFDLRRHALDYRGGLPFRLTGKGATTCDRPLKFVVLGLGGPRPGSTL